ncbi:S1C family serine protease [Spiribacter halobius]|uniref:Serine protease n=1 Tax=Sediminicurvatus halobius TaxID=2182432 RepID=A0A2U2MX61_9GAMM|nr:serine protease [Spiribacter halobius]PWG61453.1 serine protease [Spiribacter halobius]UEX77238.1 serine protease [Spiribacter halobius]
MLRLPRQAATLLLAALALVPVVSAQELPDTIERIKPAIVGVGTYQATRRPPSQLLGTGFVVLEGRHVVTADHVLPTVLDEENREQLAIFFRRGERLEWRPATLRRSDSEHDIAVLAIDGRPLPALQIGDSDSVREGEGYAFTGFPIGAVLGLYPVTHRGIVSAITPIITPANRGRELDAEAIRRLRSPFRVFQLDATAYPGNSGSPVYDTETGEVVGLLNSVFVKGSKERVLEDPSGISYAVPAQYIRALLDGIR